MKYYIQKTKIFSFVLLSSLFAEQAFAVPAFPGAEGPGAETVGGRGGRIIEVTNLNGSGPGSFREACEASGRRIVVFKVSGIIDLEGKTISIVNPYITIAGQTAPKGGITLKGHELGIRTHDVVVRFLKMRRGFDSTKGDAVGMINKGNLYNDIIDHCSLSWASDENAQIWSWTVDTAPHHITYSWNIIAEALDGHSTGFIAGSNSNTKDFKDVGLHHNLFATTSHRLPLIKVATAKMVNNLIYNWHYYATGLRGGVHMDIIANKYKPGPETTSRMEEVTVSNYGLGDINDPNSGAPGYTSIYIKGNIGPNNSNPDADNWGMTFHRWSDKPRDSLERDIYERTTPLPKYQYPITIDPIAKAETDILDHAGASQRINENGQWVNDRDSVDARIINDYNNGTGFIPASEKDVGGYPTVPAATPYSDKDHDGMADVWEDANGLDKNNYSDNELDKDNDGYTNIEEFINGTNPNSADNRTITESIIQSPRFMADVNGDGKADAVEFGNTGIMVALSTGSKFEAAGLWVNNFGSSDGWRTDKHPRMMADMNGDGMADAIGFGSKGVYVSLSTGSGFEAPRRWVDNFGSNDGWRTDKHPRMTADVNDDGMQDIVGFGSKGVYVSLSTGSGFETPRFWVDNFGSNDGWRTDKHPRMTADVNDDGMQDIVGFGSKGVYVSLSTGSGFEAPRFLVDNFGSNDGWRTDKHPRMTADVNDDGMQDIVGFGSKGVYVSLSTGSGFETPRFWVDNFGSNDGWRTDKHPRMTADVNDDGMQDIVGFGSKGVYVSLSTGSGFEAPRFLVDNFGSNDGWRTDKHPRMTADVNDDGMQDIVGFGYQGVSVSLSKNI